MFNLSNLKAVKIANERKNSTPRGQKFQFKFRRANSEKRGIINAFTIANTLWADLNLDVHGLLEVVDPETKQVYLATVDNDNAVFCKATKKGEKGKTFKNTIMEGHLIEAGLLSADTFGNTFFSLTKEAENVQMGDVVLHGVYSLAIDANASDDEDVEEVEFEEGEVEEEDEY